MSLLPECQLISLVRSSGTVPVPAPVCVYPVAVEHCEGEEVMPERMSDYRPPEAEQVKTGDLARKPTPDSIRQAMQGKSPEATGTPNSYALPDGTLVTPEKTELYHSPETRPEKEPGSGPNPSWSSPPDGSGAGAASASSDATSTSSGTTDTSPDALT